MADLAKKNRPLYRVLRRVWTVWGNAAPPMRVRGLRGRVHRNDLMFEGKSRQSIAVYGAVGRQAVDLVGRAVSTSGRSWSDVGHALDFGCGHGRVLRHLVEQVPADRITACDLDRRAVQFCAREFGVHPLVSRLDIEQLPLGQYDLIWMGSVLSHLPFVTGRQVLATLAAHLDPGGVIAFTTLGEHTFEGDDLRTSGFVYRDYAHYGESGYGLAWYTTERLQDTVKEIAPDLVCVSFQAQGWADWQDFWAFTRPG